MIYVMSDIHGCYDKYLKMLDLIRLSENDTLYILGDVIDRGEGGIAILLDMMKRENVIPLCGNHEFSATEFFDMIYNDAPLEGYEYELWMHNGGQPTYEAFAALTKEEQKRIIDYVGSFYVYEELTVGDNSFFLSHTVPEKRDMDDFENMDWQALLFAYPEYDKVYFEDMYVVTGHVPTMHMQRGGGIFRQNNHIAIDCGAVFGKALGCICLDTLEEFYAE